MDGLEEQSKGKKNSHNPVLFFLLSSLAAKFSPNALKFRENNYTIITENIIFIMSNFTLKRKSSTYTTEFHFLS